MRLRLLRWRRLRPTPDKPPRVRCPPSGASPALLQTFIEQQMQLLTAQMALLRGTTTPAPAPAAPAPVPAVVSAPAAPAAAEEDGGQKTYDVKKAFGAIARIHTKATGELTERQKTRLSTFMRRYIARTKKSKEYTTEHRPHLADPRVVNGFRPQLKEIIYQIVIDRSKGSHVWDLDGNEYVDALNGFGMSLFGWQPDFVLDAVREQLDKGYEIGPQHPLAGEVAKLVCELTGFDRAGLCNTGSEAVMGCLRIARTVTGRSKIALFTGSYHGIFDEVIVRGARKLRAVPAAPGIMPNTSENVLVLDYGTPESLQILREHADELAAVLIEPVQSRRPDFQPREFLKELREITRQSGTLFIFDEVVTGFRSHPRGAQAVLGIDADLASYGKVVGGGFPIGVIAGKREYMDALDGGGWQFGDDSIPTVGVTYFAGTFVRHPLALAAAHAVLDPPEERRRQAAGRAQFARHRHGRGDECVLPRSGRAHHPQEFLVGVEAVLRRGPSAAGPAVRDDARARHPHPRQLPLLHDHGAHRCRHRRHRQRIQGSRARTAGGRFHSAPRFGRYLAGRQQAAGARRAPRARRRWHARLVHAQSRQPRKIRQGQPMNSIPASVSRPSDDFNPFAAGAISRVAATTQPQREVWLADRLSEEASLAYNESITLRLHGALDVAALQGAVQDVINAHEALRSTFSADGQQMIVGDSLNSTFRFTPRPTPMRSSAPASAPCPRDSISKPDRWCAPRSSRSAPPNMRWFSPRTTSFATDGPSA